MQFQFFSTPFKFFTQNFAQRLTFPLIYITSIIRIGNRIVLFVLFVKARGKVSIFQRRFDDHGEQERG